MHAVCVGMTHPSPSNGRVNGHPNTVPDYGAPTLSDNAETYPIGWSANHLGGEARKDFSYWRAGFIGSTSPLRETS